MNVINFATGFVHILILPVLSESGSVEGFVLLTIVCALSYVFVTLMILNCLPGIMDKDRRHGSTSHLWLEADLIHLWIVRVRSGPGFEPRCVWSVSLHTQSRRRANNPLQTSRPGRVVGVLPRRGHHSRLYSASMEMIYVGLLGWCWPLWNPDYLSPLTLSGVQKDL